MPCVIFPEGDISLSQGYHPWFGTPNIRLARRANNPGNIMAPNTRLARRANNPGNIMVPNTRLARRVNAGAEHQGIPKRI